MLEKLAKRLCAIVDGSVVPMQYTCAATGRIGEK